MIRLANVIVPKWYLTMSLNGVAIISYYSVLSKNHIVRAFEVRNTLV